MGDIDPIPRHVDLPDGITERQLQEIEETVFHPAVPRISDVIFVFGYTADDWSHVATLFRQRMAPIILATGFYTKESPSTEKPQAHVIRESLLSEGVPDSNILVEDRSTNTGENVIFGKRVLEEHGIHPQSILFVSKAHHSGRCYRTLKKHFPDTTLSCFTVEGEYEGVKVSRHDWRDHPISQSRVYGEYLRIQRYAALGYLEK